MRHDGGDAHRVDGRDYLRHRETPGEYGGACAGGAGARGACRGARSGRERAAAGAARRPCAKRRSSRSHWRAVSPEQMAAKMIKEGMDKKYGGPWHVVCGEGFGFTVTCVPDPQSRLRCASRASRALILTPRRRCSQLRGEALLLPVLRRHGETIGDPPLQVVQRVSGGRRHFVLWRARQFVSVAIERGPLYSSFAEMCGKRWEEAGRAHSFDVEMWREVAGRCGQSR